MIFAICIMLRSIWMHVLYLMQLDNRNGCVLCIYTITFLLLFFCSFSFIYLFCCRWVTLRLHLSAQNTEQTPSKQHMQQTLAHQAQFLPLHQPHHHLNQSLFMHSQQCTPPPQLPEIAQPSAIAQHHIACMQSHGHVGGGRLHHVMVSLLFLFPALSSFDIEILKSFRKWNVILFCFISQVVLQSSAMNVEFLTSGKHPSSAPNVVLRD